jgi:hypothetical protein
VARRNAASGPHLVSLGWARVRDGHRAESLKLKALAKNPKVALTIDDNNFPHKILLVRGTARLQSVAGIVPEYAMAAERYFGAEKGKAWVEQIRAMRGGMTRIGITPEWVGLLDFETRFPGTLSV